MKKTVLWQILLYILLIIMALAAGALLAYPAQLLLPDVVFSRLAERGSLICGLLASLLYVRWSMPLTITAIGFRRPDTPVAGTLTRAYLAGIVVMLVPAVLLWWLGLSRIDAERDFTLAFFAVTLLKGLLAGIGAGLIEETLFRGALFSGLQQRINVLWAIILSSLLYSAVHFIEYPEPAGAVYWYTGLQLFPAAMAKLAEPQIFTYFLTLFLLGVLLAMLRWRDGHIWRAFGLHAGVVLILKLNGYITDRVNDSHYDYLVNTYSGRLGWLTAIWLLLLIMAYGWHIRRQQQK